MGAAQNRLNSTINNLGIQAENISAANSRIRDIDVALETSDLTRNSILQQASLSILAQADLDLVRRLLDQVDGLTETLSQGPPLSREAQDQLVLVQRMHGKLLTTIAAERSQVRATMQESQKGRRALKSYGGKGTATGTQWESLE